MITNTCQFCENDFLTYPSINSKCCSVACSFSLQKKISYEKYKTDCEQCGKEFLPKRQAQGGRFCSYQCTGMFNRHNKVDRSGRRGAYR